MSTILIARRSWLSASAVLLAVFVYLYTTVTSLPVPETEPFRDDFLTPYLGGRHGSGRTTRDIKECQHVNWENRTYEEFKLDLSRPHSTQLLYNIHRFADTIKREYFQHKYIIGSISFVNNPYYTLSVLEPHEKGGCEKKYFSTTRNTVRETARLRSHGCVLATNAGYFSMLNGQCLGNIVSDGRVVQTASDEQNANFGIRQDGTIVVGYIPDEEIVNTTNPFRQLIAGVIWLVRNGTNYVNESVNLECASHEDTGNMETFASVVSARTAIGHDNQGRLVLAQVEGQTHRRGTNLRDFADLLIRRGVANAINLDGGGSSTFIHKDILVNDPSDHCSGSPEYRCERAVSTAICIHDVECLEPDCNGHGSCDLGQCTCDEPWLGEACDKLNCSLTDCSGNGNCSEGVCSCEAGWMGEECNTTCPKSHYGPNCKNYCYCYGKSYCDQLTGKCLCPPGYHGFGCWQECEAGTYGIDCASKCDYPDCSGHGKCSNMNGTCQCELGWTGESCNETLGSGSGAIDEDLLYPNETFIQPTKTFSPTYPTASQPASTETTNTLTASGAQIFSSTVTTPSSSQSTSSQMTLTIATSQSNSSEPSSGNSTNTSSNVSGLATNSTCSTDHQNRNALLLGVLLAALTLCGHASLCWCSRRSSGQPWRGRRSRIKRTKPVKRRRLRRKKKPVFVPVPQESSSDCSI